MDPNTQQMTRQHVSDSRLLQNLYKSEKTYLDHLSSAVASAFVASSALSSWGTSEPADVSSAAAEISEGLDSVASAQRTHVQAIEGYRAALKDVLDREQSIRSIVRDRDILVKRLIKADQKRAKSAASDPSKDAERHQKHLHAQRELAACEDALEAEENALIGVKRRTFKEALTMRMKTMGDAGAAMVEAAKDAIILLDSFDSNGQMSMPSPIPSRQGDGAAGWEYSEQPYDDDGQITGADASFNQFNENASVTPSQSASQINYNAGAQQSRPARYAGGNFNDIGETSNGQENGEQSDPYDANQALALERANSEADSDQDYQDAFATNAHTAHSNHQQQQGRSEPPTPTPPRKEDRTMPSTGGYPQVSMPPVPTAPSLSVGGPNMGPIPTASRVYLRGQDSSSEDDDQPPVRSASRSGWTSHIGTGAHRRQESGDSGASAVRGNPSRSSSFFGRMGRLFKTGLKNTPTANASSPNKANAAETGAGTGQQERPSSRAETPSRGLGRGISLLRGAAGPDSSDEEDAREYVRHTNPRQPMWKAPGKASSDIGGKGKLAVIPPSARITPGPMSSRQAKDHGDQDQQPRAQGSRPISMVETVSTSVAKKKKKKGTSTRRASSAFETGSEVGTAPTRAAGYQQGVSPIEVVKEDAASVGPRGTLNRQSSVRSSGTAVGSTTGKKKKASKHGVTAMTAFSTGETSGKFSTSNWVSRPGNAEEAPSASIAQAVANAGVPSEAATAPATSAATPSTPTRQPSVRNKTAAVGTPINVPSASKSPPLKPALKHPSAVNRSNSQTTDLSSGYQDLPQLAAPIKAPPPITLQDDPSSLQGPPPLTSDPASSAADSSAPSAKKTKAKAPAMLKLQPDEAFDGSGRLGVPGTSPVPSPAKEKGSDAPKTAPAPSVDEKKQRETNRFPRIDMPKSEPFKLDLAHLRGDGATATAMPRASIESEGQTPASDREFLTPTEQEAYHLFMASPQVPEVEVKQSARKEVVENSSGVTRTTERRTRLVPSRTYSIEKTPRKSESSSELSDDAAATEVGRGPSIPAADLGNSKHTDVQASAPNGNNDESALRSLRLPASASMAKSDTSESGVSRRKSVRMAPDVKLPPETPNSSMEAPLGSVGNGKEYPFGTDAASSEAPRPARLGAPAAAPARVQQEESPVDTGRERPSWNTRIGAGNDSSSDDDDGDGYVSARKAFGSATRHLGAATGSLKQKAKDAVSTTSKGKKKKKADGSFSVDVVGRSSSSRK
ncbi:unnamed protein product [Tilletia controversa]|uniref:Uncharacterized protein n=1 Tax=Tilletia controversa TaxID=13291 RepID=A0A8X7MX34_9BASI|nr:hypothetical protein A4X06_0g2068 [Tilletia controversa]CAD6975935.1 unnamed protein product [Tilletia controversa]